LVRVWELKSQKRGGTFARKVFANEKGGDISHSEGYGQKDKGQMAGLRSDQRKRLI